MDKDDEGELNKVSPNDSDDIDHSNISTINSDRESIATSAASQYDDNTIPRPSGPKRKLHWAIRILKLVLSQWFLISLGLVIVIASQVQVPESQQETKSTVVSYLCISIIFFLTGLTLNTRILLDNYTRWKLHLFVQIECYLLTSSVVFAIITLCSLNENFMDPGLLLGFLLAGCTPTTIASNVIMTEQAHGTKALTVVQSTLGNFLAPFITPPLFNMYLSGHPWYGSVLPDETGGYGAVYRRVFKQLGLSLFVPMVCNACVLAKLGFLRWMPTDQ
jgi:solute carrier family 10 (sodium/bile acid cotransporter), member 7